jgi:transglutaminase-like putative cysteine protease
MGCLQIKTNIIAISGLLMICVSQTHAQSSVWAEMKERYPDESAIFLTRNKVITLEVKQDSVTASATMEESILFLKDRPGDATDMRIFGSHFQEIENVQAATSVWEKSKYKEIPLSGLTRQREDDNSVFFDDSYFYHLSFPAGQAGNQANWSYTEKYRDARFLPTFYFQDYLTQRKGSLLIRAPKNVELKWHIFNDQENKIQFKQFEKGGYRHYEWTVEDLPAVKREERSPKYSYFVPLVVFHVTAIQEKDQTVPVLSGLNDLHKWYYETIRKVDEPPAAQLTEVAKKLVVPEDSEIDIVRKVFYWVQDNIRYIAFEDGMRGLVPHKPSYVLDKRYGDCKDMASIIVGMLKSLNIKSYYTWIGTRDIPFQYSMIPTPLVDNHMIATYIDKDKNYFFLDGTSNFTSLYLPSSMIQGKEAFIILNDTEYEVKKVPEISSRLSEQTDTVRLRLDNGTLYGKGSVHYSGYQKIFASYDFNKTVASKQKDYVSYWLKKGSNKFILNNYTIKNMEDKDKPLSISYDFHINDYITYIDSEIYVNLNLVKIYYNQVIKPDRKVSMEMDYKFSANDVYYLEIPEGYEIEYLPPDAQRDTGPVNFGITYTHTASTIQVNQRLENNILLLTADQFEAWNKVIRELSNSYKESIILKKKTL